jgi:hypothetical protein
MGGAAGWQARYLPFSYHVTDQATAFPRGRGDGAATADPAAYARSQLGFDWLVAAAPPVCARRPRSRCTARLARMHTRRAAAGGGAAAAGGGATGGQAGATHSTLRCPILG